MKYLGLIVVATMTLVAEQVLAGRINEMDSQLELLQTRGYNEKFREFLEKSRVIVRDGNSSLGVPPMDPFKNESIKFDIDEKFVSGEIELSDFNITGLSGYVVNTAEIAMLARKGTISLTWPVIKSAGSYKMNFVAMEDYKLFGSGKYMLTLENLSFITNVWVKLSGGVAIKKMETDLSLGSLSFSATGLLNDDDMSEVISSVISDMGPQLLRDYQKEITTTINDVVTKKVNQYLEGKSIQEIIAILG